MHRPTYAIARAFTRHVACMSVNHRVLHGEWLRRPGPFLIACTHIGHLEPALLAATIDRPIHWVARLEFYRRGWAAVLLRHFGAIPVNRFGVPISTVRESVRKLNDGQIVGIFPEGGRTHGQDQAIHGGPIKGGACLIAERAGVPILPVVMLGIDAMHAVKPFLPGQRTTIQTIVGQPIVPAATHVRIGRRSRRQAMTAKLAQAFLDLHAEAAGGQS